MTLPQLYVELGYDPAEVSPEQVEQVASGHRASVFDSVCERIGCTPAELSVMSPDRLEQHVKASRPQMKALDREVMMMSLKEYLVEKSGAKVRPSES